MYHLSGNHSFRLKFRSPETLSPELEDDLPEQNRDLPGLKVDSPGIFS